MTNNEILQASLLDIIFENRNKDYGAYALRRGYNHRLLIAIGTAMSVILLFVFISMLEKNNETIVTRDNTPGIEIRQIELPKDNPKEPENPKEVVKPKQAEKIATIQYVNKIEIKPDDQVKVTTPDISELSGKLISTKTTEGNPDDGKTKPVEMPVIDPGTGNNTESASPENDFIERNPEFPGGPEALQRFLSGNLSTPEELEAGEKKMVQIRFKVDKDGTVSTLEIVKSGGNEFDREVIRVCRKMPRWKPAVQNGVNVPVSYVLPVTFIGVEQ